MTLDREEHRAILLELINKSAFPGQFAETVAELKAALASADVQPPKIEDPSAG